jgi:thioredoxin-related protein
MIKTIPNKSILASLVVCSVLFTACNDNNSEAKIIEPTVEKESTQSTPIQDPKVIYAKYDKVVYDVFKDTAKIAPDGQYMLIVFGTNTDPYTDRLKADIKNTEELSKKIKNDFSSYYLKAHENLRHKLFHEGELMDVDTKTMLSIYGIESTPTLIFADKKGKAIIVVPGYMPSNQFLTTLKFIEDKEWVGKDRKNGEVYATLRDYYVKNNIDVIKKDK